MSEKFDICTFLHSLGKFHILSKTAAFIKRMESDYIWIMIGLRWIKNLMGS